jgi:hypothetical protein
VHHAQEICQAQVKVQATRRSLLHCPSVDSGGGIAGIPANNKDFKKNPFRGDIKVTVAEWLHSLHNTLDCCFRCFDLVKAIGHSKNIISC